MRITYKDLDNKLKKVNRFLKFEEEGLMKKYDQDGFDYIRFARIEL